MKLVRGFGINDLGYSPYTKEYDFVDGKKVLRTVHICPYYSRWADMLERCYSEKFQSRRPSYKGFTVDPRWKLATEFKIWMSEQPWEGGMHLDKDILVQGNTIYSPGTCLFVPQEINKLLLIRSGHRGEYPLGVHYQKPDKNMISERSKPFLVRACNFLENTKDKYVGYFSTEEDAHAAWQVRKAEIIIDAIDWWRTEPKVSHTFREDAAKSLLKRAEKLVYDSSKRIQTVYL